MLQEPLDEGFQERAAYILMEMAGMDVCVLKEVLLMRSLLMVFAVEGGCG